MEAILAKKISKNELKYLTRLSEIMDFQMPNSINIEIIWLMSKIIEDPSLNIDNLVYLLKKCASNLR